MSGRTPATSDLCPALWSSRQEIKLAQKRAQKFSAVPDMWSKCLLGHVYGLWFLYLPTLVRAESLKVRSLHTAYGVLQHMDNRRVVLPDEVSRSLPGGWGGGLAPVTTCVCVCVCVRCATGSSCSCVVSTGSRCWRSESCWR